MSNEAIALGPFFLQFDADRAWFLFAPGASAKVAAQQGTGSGDLARLLGVHRAALRGKQLVVDLQDAAALDSIQIGMLLALHKACRPYGRVGLAHVSDGVAKLLRVTAIERLFDVVGEEVCW